MPVRSDESAFEPVSAARPNRAAEVRVYPLGDEALVYAPAAQAAYALNRSALAIFELCDGQRTVADIGREVARTLGCAPDTLLPDVGQGVSELREAGLVSYD
jgi:Coenzyme PQQ synthesis protein D (PqqD)